MTNKKEKRLKKRKRRTGDGGDGEPYTAPTTKQPHADWPLGRLQFAMQPNAGMQQPKLEIQK